MGGKLFSVAMLVALVCLAAVIAMQVLECRLLAVF